MVGNTLLIVGLGDLGGHVLEFLARTPRVGKIVAADINEDWGIRKINNAILGAAHQGFYPHIEFVKIDLNDIEGTARDIENIDPDLIYNSTTLQSWWVIGELPEKVFKKLLGAGLGPWLPMHLTLPYKLMKAVKKAGVNSQVVNSSYPDAVNPALGKVNLAPTVGIGNIDLIIPQIKKVASEKLKVPMQNVQVFMVAHHFHDASLETFGSTQGAPYFLKVLVGDRNVTDELNPDKLLTGWTKRVPIPDGRMSHQQVASSAVKNILAILNDTGELTHAPGPNGLPGGYPVRLSAKGAEVVLPEELTLEEAIKINEEAQKFDGIEKIENDGTVIFTDKSANIMREMLRYDCKEFKVEECADKAKELGSLYKSFVGRYSRECRTHLA